MIEVELEGLDFKEARIQLTPLLFGEDIASEWCKLMEHFKKEPERKYCKSKGNKQQDNTNDRKDQG